MSFIFSSKVSLDPLENVVDLDNPETEEVTVRMENVDQLALPGQEEHRASLDKVEK